jgi:chromosome segregation ATPase
MAEASTSTQAVRDRLTALLADWGTELSAILNELEQQRSLVAQLESRGTGHEEEVRALRQRVDGQEALIDTLKGEAEEASRLRADVRSRDLDLERVTSELDSKKELIRALRRDADSTDRLKADAKLKDREIEELRAQLQRAEAKISDLNKDLVVWRDAAAGKAGEAADELETLKAELEARKTLIKSLRADQDRIGALEKALDEKRDVIEHLEGTINRQSTSITELKRSTEIWKHKYQTVKGDSPTATTSVNIPSLSETDVRAIEQIEKQTAGKTDATIAIDMRRSLLEARRTAAHGGEK